MDLPTAPNAAIPGGEKTAFPVNFRMFLMPKIFLDVLCGEQVLGQYGHYTTVERSCEV